MGVDAIPGSNPARGTGQQAASLPVPTSVTDFLNKSTSMSAFTTFPSHDNEAFKLVKSLPPDIGDFFAQAGALQAGDSKKLMVKTDDAGNTYVLYPHNNNLWAKKMPVYGMAITPEGNRVIVKGSNDEKRWGGASTLKLEATGKVFGPNDDVALLAALREQRGVASTGK